MEEKGQKDGIKRAEERHSDRETERGGADCQPSASSLSQPAGMQIWSQTRHTDRHTDRSRGGGDGRQTDGRVVKVINIYVIT